MRTGRPLRPVLLACALTVAAAGLAPADASAGPDAADTTPPAAPALTATPDTSLPLGSGQGRVDVHVQAPADAVRLVVRRGTTVLADGAPPATDLHDDGLADGTHYAYTAIAYDAAGNASEPAHAAADTPDRTAPATPAAPTGGGYPLRLGWADEAGTTLTLERDGTPVARTAHAAVTDVDAVDAAPPAVPAGVAVDDAGRTTLTLHWQAVADRGTTYRFTVHGEDEAGNVGAASAAATLVAQADDVAYRVLIDGVVVAETRAAHATLTGLTGGVRRTVTVVAVDAAGNPSDPSDALGVGRDEAPTAPAGVTARTPTKDAPALRWDAVADATGYVVRRDGHELARVPGTSYIDEGAMDDATDDGVYAYTVAAVGAAGLVGDATAPFRVTLDTTPPDTTIADPGATTRPDVALALGPAEPGMTFRCQLDEIAPADCSSPWALQALAAGAHRVTVTAIDAAGNADPTPATRTFTVDDSAPAAPSLSAVADATVLTGSALGRVTVTAAARAGGVRVVVTEGARLVLDAAGGTLIEDLPDDADLTYLAVAYDAVGNASPPASVTVHPPDRTAPEAPQVTGAGGYPLTLHWTMEDGAYAVVRRGRTTVADTDRRSATDEDATDEAAPDAPDGVVATGVTTGGFDVAWEMPADHGTTYTYTATVRDAAGNVSPPAAATPALATSGIARYRVLVDGAQVAEVTAAHAHLDGFAAGSEHRVTVVAVDAAGNASARSGVAPVTLAARSGTPPPTARILTEPVVTRPHLAVHLGARVAAGTAPVTAVTWRFADGTTAAGSAVDHRFRTAGTQLVRLTATDAGGGTAAGSMTVVVDGRAPVAKLDGATPGGAVLFATDDLSGVESLTARWAGGSATVKGPRLVVKLPAKVTTVKATARDRAGNVGTVSLRLRTDRVGPKLRVTAPALSLAAEARITIRAKGARISVDGRKRGTTVSVTTGRRHVIEAVDRAGNRSRVVLLVPRDTAIAKLTGPALDGTRHDELWPGAAAETGVRRYLLRAAELRLVIAGSLPASLEQTDALTPDVAAALKAFQTAHHLTASGRIEAATKAALDRIASNTTIVWSDG